MNGVQLERKVCSLICQSDGIKAREIARLMKLDRNTVNHILYTSPLLQELCWQDRDYRWHGIIGQARPHLNHAFPTLSSKNGIGQTRRDKTVCIKD